MPAGAPPTPPEEHDTQDWASFETRVRFKLAEELYLNNEASASSIDRILNIWAAHCATFGKDAPFRDHQDVYSAIDSSPLGGMPWQSINISYDGDVPATDVPEWMSSKHEVWFRDLQKVVHEMISNPDFKKELDYAPYREFRNGKRQWSDFMSGNWSWRQAVRSSLIIKFILTLE